MVISVPRYPALYPYQIADCWRRLANVAHSRHAEKKTPAEAGLAKGRNLLGTQKPAGKMVGEARIGAVRPDAHHPDHRAVLRHNRRTGHAVANRLGGVSNPQCPHRVVMHLAREPRLVEGQQPSL